jgi:hypothetical protein
MRLLYKKYYVDFRVEYWYNVNEINELPAENGQKRKFVRVNLINDFYYL